MERHRIWSRKYFRSFKNFLKKNKKGLTEKSIPWYNSIRKRGK